MKQTLTREMFIDGMKAARPGNFTYEGLDALFEYLTELEEGLGEELEFDPIAICCEYSEYRSLEEIREDYNNIEDLEDLVEGTTAIVFLGAAL